MRFFTGKLKIGSLDEARARYRSGRLRSLGGFGAKSEQRLLEAILSVKSGHAKQV